MSHEERIRRAEEIYRRRREENPYSRTTRVYHNEEKEEKNFYLFKKMFLQIAICLVIYFIFYLIQNSNYIFSEEVLEKTKQILSYDIDIASLYEQTSKFILEQIQGLTPSQEQNEEQQENENIVSEAEESQENNENKENTTEESESKENVSQVEKSTQEENGIKIGALAGQNGKIEQNETKLEEGMGGVELEDMLEGSKVATEEQIPMSDEEYIKTNFSFIKPVEGIVSSEFGPRDVANPIVSKNHTGIDIAANTGTAIKASMEGTVTVSSTVRRLWLSHKNYQQ